jgi:hypothetical protein
VTTGSRPAPGARPGSGVSGASVCFIRRTNPGAAVVDVGLGWQSRFHIDATAILDLMAEARPDTAQVSAVLTASTDLSKIWTGREPVIHGSKETVQALSAAMPTPTITVVWYPRLIAPRALPGDDEIRAIVRWQAPSADLLPDELSPPTLSDAELEEAMRIRIDWFDSSPHPARPLRAELNGGATTVSWGRAPDIEILRTILGPRHHLTPWERGVRAAHEAQMTAGGGQVTERQLAATARAPVGGLQALSPLFPGLLRDTSRGST